MTELLIAIIPGYIGGAVACWITLMMRFEPRNPWRFLFVAVFWPYYFFRIIVMSRFDF
jgi:multisubunit Na+/H+ antiporter MnhE subunit